jgi:hypothetical protein
MIKTAFFVFLACLLVLPAQAEESPELPDIKVQVARKKRKKDSKKGDFDDKVQEIRLIATIENEEFDDLTGLTCTLKIIGEIMTDELRDAREEAFIILHEQTKKFEVKGMGETEVETDPIEVQFDESNAARRGARYEGYLVKVTDAKGRILFSDSDKRYLRENLAAANKLPVMEPFNDELEPKPKISHSVRVTTP